MKISIITVVYNNEKTIETAITSVLSQSYDNIEYIIIDGGSTDGTVEKIEQYRARIQKIISEPDLGIYDAMNKGIKLADSDVIGIINSDDLYIDNDVLKNVMQCFIQDPGLDIVYSDLVYVKKDEIDKVVRKWVSQPFYDKFFEQANVPPHPTLFLRKRVYDQAGLFNTDLSLAADYEFMLRIFKKFNFKSKYLNRVIIKMRLGGASTKSFENILRQNKEVLRSWKLNGLAPPPFFMLLRLITKLKQFFFKTNS